MRGEFPSWFKKLYPRNQTIWNMPRDRNLIYLTFDDGPIPGITDKVLTILDACEIKATFFLCGKNIESYPEIVSEINQKGHKIGNHGYLHRKLAWQSEKQRITDIKKTAKLINTGLFRPPYGSLFPWQTKDIIKQFGYKVVFWSLMPMDFSSSYSPDECCQIVTRQLKPGDIIVLHDTQAAANNMFPVLDTIISIAKRNNWSFGLVE